ncbi:FBP domain-containing protein [Ruania halotolerans]|uniref:FBP domain-containing protein n=1 Tax=Ruania halotolerans TaxID=2897773 RepID=UPI001E2D42E8|nr:FBP domain-containing protein [Ruania halotolerans]UFU07814.1 FBP domain-containing protein [Ruania halotolerans]
MNPLTEKQIRTSFVNATRGEASRAVLPDLGAIDWDRLEYLGWRDPKAPLNAYVVLELDEAPRALMLRAPEPGGRRRQAMCAWCEDIVAVDTVGLHVARRAGAPGRRGDTIGTLLCTDFACSAHVRRRPTRAEASTDADRERFVAHRIAGLRERSMRFVAEVCRTR